jgi:hypothetical protein
VAQAQESYGVNEHVAHSIVDIQGAIVLLRGDEESRRKVADLVTGFDRQRLVFFALTAVQMLDKLGRKEDEKDEESNT